MNKIRKAVEVLRSDGLIIIPTDTVYGLACNADSSLAIEMMYRLKQRARNKPFVIFVHDIDFLGKLGIKVAPEMKELLCAFWPGAITFVFGKVAARIPDHPVALAVLREFGGPLAVTSANISGGESPVDFSQIEPCILEGVGLAIDGGGCLCGKVSTMVDVSGDEPKVLRDGAIPAEKILGIWKEKFNAKKREKGSQY